jgi:hypothetical protein
MAARLGGYRRRALPPYHAERVRAGRASNVLDHIDSVEVALFFQRVQSDGGLERF